MWEGSKKFSLGHLKNEMPLRHLGEVSCGWLEIKCLEFRGENWARDKIWEPSA